MRKQKTDAFLLDGNLLVALRIDTHEHHECAHNWFNLLGPNVRFATCAITEGTLLRVHMAVAQDRSAQAAWEALAEIRNHPVHQYWKAGFSYTEVAFRGLTGGKQVTDAWLAELARRKQGKLATLDTGLAAVHADVAVLVS
ncbi:MAG: TA system VapC family ribonuclease toxin [Oceanipulchritudo sp.]